MTASEILARAREGDAVALSNDTSAVANAVRAFAESGDPAAALELVGRAFRIWTAAAKLDEGNSAAAAALSAPGASTVPIWYTRALYADGLLAFRGGDDARSLARNEEALRIARESGDVRGECDALTGLARLALRDGRYGDVVALARDGRQRARAAKDVEAEAAPLHLQAAGVRLQQDYASARELYLESLALNTRRGNTAWVAMEHHNLGWVELHLDNVDAAEAMFRERDAGPVPDSYGEAWSELNWSAVAFMRGDIDLARRRFEAGTHALGHLGVTLDPDDKAELDWLRGLLEARVDR